MAEDNLFSRVKNAIRGQKDSFCSRSTKVTPLEEITNATLIEYTNCDSVVTEIPYGDITITGGYIPDCVQGGSPIKTDSKNPVKLFVQYGTTDCNTPPPGSNLIVVSCSKGESSVIDPSGFTLQKDAVHYLSFNNNVISDGCYTIGDTTSQTPIDSLRNDPGQAYKSCLGCQSSLA
jgi:hypothetical protein